MLTYKIVMDSNDNIIIHYYWLVLTSLLLWEVVMTWKEAVSMVTGI